jgi:hypothetical protein
LLLWKIDGLLVPGNEREVTKIVENKKQKFEPKYNLQQIVQYSDRKTSALAFGFVFLGF